MGGGRQGWLTSAAAKMIKFIFHSCSNSARLNMVSQCNIYVVQYSMLEMNRKEKNKVSKVGKMGSRAVRWQVSQAPAVGEWTSPQRCCSETYGSSSEGLRGIWQVFKIGWFQPFGWCQVLICSKEKSGKVWPRIPVACWKDSTFLAFGQKCSASQPAFGDREVATFLPSHGSHTFAHSHLNFATNVLPYFTRTTKCSRTFLYSIWS